MQTLPGERGAELAPTRSVPKQGYREDRRGHGNKARRISAGTASGLTAPVHSDARPVTRHDMNLEAGPIRREAKQSLGGKCLGAARHRPKQGDFPSIVCAQGLCPRQEGCDSHSASNPDLARCAPMQQESAIGPLDPHALSQPKPCPRSPSGRRARTSARPEPQQAEQPTWKGWDRSRESRSLDAHTMKLICWQA